MCPIANRIAGYRSCKCIWIPIEISWNGVSLCFHPASDQTEDSYSRGGVLFQYRPDESTAENMAL